ncbi:MAG: single-stranded-DNA-specific exonuclease RecJ [Deltaproteobacteria bacterium]|nr:single-stranded-DNA-specific exonuclease RecJ [Deltaproteobacteria bacterium]
MSQANIGLQEVFCRDLEVSPITAQLLINRGLVDVNGASSFLRPDLKELHDPFLLKDMERAVGRIKAALDKKEKIAVYGDYDVDGTTSAAILYLFFKELGVEVRTYIPDRRKEGYGLNAGAISLLSEEGVTLIITVDCGISNFDEIGFASSIGTDIIVTDHHEPGFRRPPAFAVINPRQEGCAFPFKGLAGCGVAFNLLMALRARLRGTPWLDKGEPNLKKYCGLVSIGTIADMAPLLDENRILVSHGLKEIESPWRPGLAALKEASGIRANAPVDAEKIAFQIAPRINAAGRLTQASLALRLLVTDDPVEAASCAAALDRENAARQLLEVEILKDAVSIMSSPQAALPEKAGDKGIVLYSDKWHPGVIGIVASRLVEMFGKPTVLISLDKEVGKGSVRSIKSFDILKALSSCEGVLLRYGGHRMAAGLTLARMNIEEFKKEFAGYLNRHLTEDDLIPEITMDALVSLNEMDLKLMSEIESLAPHGVANRVPLFCMTGAEVLGTEVVKVRHLRFKLKHNGVRNSAIGFNMAPLHPVKGDGFAVAFSASINEWRGVKSLGLRIKDIKPCPRMVKSGDGAANILT